jgi:signal transduction histidine kinase
MRERIEKLGGELEILSSPGEGTQIIACVNLVGPAENPQEE